MTLVPPPGFKTIPGSSLMAHDDGSSVIITPVPVNEVSQFAKLLRSPAALAQLNWSKVEAKDRPQGAIKRTFFQFNASEKLGQSRRHGVLIYDDRSAATIVVTMPKALYDANPGIALAADRLLESVGFADQALAIAYAYKVVPPPGFRPAGAVGGQVQVFAHGERELLMFIRMEKPTLPADLSRVADGVVPATLGKQFEALETIDEQRTRSGTWEFYERSFKGRHVKIGAVVEGLIRIQTSDTNVTYMTLAYVAQPPISEGMLNRIRTAFESIKEIGPAGPEPHRQTASSASASVACSEAADAQKLHGRERMEFRNKCIADHKAGGAKR